MGLFNLFKREYKRDMDLSSQTLSPIIVNSGNDGQSFISNTVNASTALTNSDIFAIVSRISANIAGIDFKTMNPDVSHVIEQPSPLINGFSFWQKVICQMLLTGNAYVMIVRDNDDKPLQLIHVPANNVQIKIVNESGTDDVKDIVYQVTVAEQNGCQYIVPSRNMLHFRCLVSGSDAQTNGYCGISPLVSLAREVSIQNNSNRLAVQAISHAIAPSFTLKMPTTKLSDKNKENIRTNFEKSVSGSNSGRAIILDTSMDVEPLQINPNLDKLLSNSTFSQSQIAKAFNIPTEFLNGVGDQQSSITEMTSLYVNALSIYLKPIISELELKFGCDVTADFASSIDVDHQQLIKNVVSLSTSKSPVISPHLAIQILKNAGAMGLDGISDDDIDKYTVSSPPTTTKGDENNED